MTRTMPIVDIDVDLLCFGVMWQSVAQIEEWIPVNISKRNSVNQEPEAEKKLASSTRR